MKSAVLVFPGINRERDMARTLKLISGVEPAMVWHADTELPAGTDLVVVPGGFSYGDYLRCGAIAARAPIMDAVRAHAAQGRPRARRLQRLPDPVRVRPAAGRADAQFEAEIHLPRRASARGAVGYAVHARLQCRAGDPRAGGAWRGHITLPIENTIKAIESEGRVHLPLLRGRRHDRRSARTSTARSMRLPASSTKAAMSPA